ncbi:uncharacterized protein BKA55DRAFT_20705 [Fusarium redolens]|uniref:Uncharacterized protein n=1 Tax=Fusarium redolens TaxID=48865 RepID=A0A9P9KWI0_FUSRE|nr:uncharacterized protein BKA55DRAFT_20705 [Fusarium redolens]KAH7269727.1 hypothetical protein BKA55DRAFT_20705 [Fusarium redolens]
MPQEMRVIVITSSPPVHLVLSFNGKPEISANTVCPDWTFLSLYTITNHQSPITNHQSPITNHQSPITNHQSPITNHQSPITNHQSPITNHQSPITNHQSPITNHQSPITNHQSPITKNWYDFWKIDRTKCLTSQPFVSRKE